MPRDSGLPTICRKCGTMVEPKNAVAGTLDDDRTCICEECGE